MIYVLEDDANIRKLVDYALTREGYSVEGFGTPAEFWAAVGRQIPQLVLLDIMLPQEDGLSVLQKLRSRSDTRRLPVIMLTARSSEFDKVTGLDSGADDYIAKPFGMMELISRIRAVLRRTGPETEEKSWRIGSLYVQPGRHIVQAGGVDVALTYKEYELLCALLEADGRVLTRDTLLSTSGAMILTEIPGLWMYISAGCARNWEKPAAVLKQSRASDIRSEGETAHV